MKPAHPGAILREDVLKPLHLTITDAAKGLEISRKQLSEIINEKAGVTAEMAVRLEQGFKIAASFWLDLQKEFDLWKVQQSGHIHLKPLTRMRA